MKMETRTKIEEAVQELEARTEVFVKRIERVKDLLRQFLDNEISEETLSNEIETITVLLKCDVSAPSATQVH